MDVVLREDGEACHLLSFVWVICSSLLTLTDEERVATAFIIFSHDALHPLLPFCYLIINVCMSAEFVIGDQWDKIKAVSCVCVCVDIVDHANN